MKLNPDSPPDSGDYYLGLALAVRRKANCLGSRVGAVVVKDNRVISTGYNGVPEGMKNCLDGGCLRCSNPGGRFKSGEAYDLCICVHAEQNALLAAARFGISVAGAHIFTTTQPCFGCAKELLQAKIERVTYIHPWEPRDSDPDMEAAKKAEHRKIIAELKTRQYEEAFDPVAQWAVRKLKEAVKTPRLRSAALRATAKKSFQLTLDPSAHPMRRAKGDGRRG